MAGIRSVPPVTVAARRSFRRKACSLHARAQAPPCGLDLGIGGAVTARPPLGGGFRIFGDVISHQCARQAPQHGWLFTGEGALPPDRQHRRKGDRVSHHAVPPSLELGGKLGRCRLVPARVSLRRISISGMSKLAIARSDHVSAVAQRAKSEAIRNCALETIWIDSRRLSSAALRADPLARNDEAL